MKNTNKRGSHVSLVLSFTIFVVSLIFVYIIVSPLVSREGTQKNSLSTLKENILERITSEIWVLRAYDLSSPPVCVELTVPIQIPEASSVAFDDNGSIPSSISGDKIYVEGGNGFMKIYYSEKFRKKFKKLVASNIKLSREVQTKILVLGSHPTHNSLRLHKLSGSLCDAWSISINRSFRVIFQYVKEGVLLIDLGTHDEVY